MLTITAPAHPLLATLALMAQQIHTTLWAASCEYYNETKSEGVHTNTACYQADASFNLSMAYLRWDMANHGLAWSIGQSYPQAVIDSDCCQPAACFPFGIHHDTNCPNTEPF